MFGMAMTVDQFFARLGAIDRKYNDQSIDVEAWMRQRWELEQQFKAEHGWSALAI